MYAQIVEYRYTAAAARRTLLLFGASVALSVALVIVLAAGWQSLSSFSLLMGIVLLVVIVGTVRAQLERLNFMLRLGPAALDLLAPLNRQSIAWSDISEVRRIARPRMFGSPGWACAVVARQPRGRRQRLIFVFDSGLEQAEQAFQDIVARSGAPITGG